MPGAKGVDKVTPFLEETTLLETLCGPETKFTVLRETSATTAEAQRAADDRIRLVSWRRSTGPRFPCAGPVRGEHLIKSTCRFQTDRNRAKILPTVCRM
jgi:hypothetical protein